MRVDACCCTDSRSDPHLRGRRRLLAGGGGGLRADSVSTSVSRFSRTKSIVCKLCGLSALANWPDVNHAIQQRRTTPAKTAALQTRTPGSHRDCDSNLGCVALTCFSRLPPARSRSTLRHAAQLHLIHHLREHPGLDSLSAMMTTVSSGRSTCRRSISGRTSRMSTRRLSIQMSPFGRIAIRMLPDSLLSAVSASSLVDGDARFLHEGSRDDEEDQQVQHEVQHRREIDAGLFVCVACMLVSS